MKRIYPRTQGYWVYSHTTPEKEVYIGISKRQPKQRWIPSLYKTTALQEYIERFGWENIEHKVLIDNLTKEQAEQIEDWFITNATTDGFCINSNRSGGHERDNRKGYQKCYREAHKDEIRERKKVWYEANRDEIQEQHKNYRESHKEQRKAYIRQYNSSTEGKIYYRVCNYNRNHTPIETPKEAKQKYISTGYIPTYIKRDDLI